METKIAAQLYTLRDFLKTPADIAQTLARVKKIGYEAVQLSGLGPIDPQELKKILDNEGLKAISTHTSLEELQGDFEAFVEKHKLWECTHTAIAALPGDYRHAEGYKKFAREASVFARKLAAAGITLGYHNHSFELEKFAGRTGLEIIYAESDSLLTGEIDTYWIQHGGGDPVAWICKLKGRLPVVHFKDMGVVGGQQVMTEVGEGNLDWPALIAACAEAGTKWHVVEQDVCQRDPFESLAISLRNLQALGLK